MPFSTGRPGKVSIAPVWGDVNSAKIVGHFNEWGELRPGVTPRREPYIKEPYFSASSRDSDFAICAFCHEMIYDGDGWMSTELALERKTLFFHDKQDGKSCVDIYNHQHSE